MPDKKSRLNSNSDNKCHKCQKNSHDNNHSIGRDNCNGWYHASCAEIEVEHLPIIFKYSSLFWYCNKCQPVLDVVNSKTFISRMDKILREQESKFAENHTLLLEITKQQEINKQKIEENLTVAEEAKSKLSYLKPQTEALNESEYDQRAYADVVKHKLHMKSPRNVEKIERDPETILIANPTKNFWDSMAIKKEYAKYFPLKRLVYAFNTACGKIHLPFISPEEASEVLNKWNKNCFGEKSQIRKANQPERPLRAVLIRDVPTELSEEDIIDSIVENYPDSTASRFVKEDRTPLGTVKIVFKSGQLHEKALNEGIFVDNIYYRTQKFIQTGIQIIRCFKCQKFGHISMNCKSDTACGHCTDIHKYKDCTMKHEAPKCVNCSEAHTSDSTSCTAYLRQLITVYNARGVEITISVKKRVASLYVQTKHQVIPD